MNRPRALLLSLVFVSLALPLRALELKAARWTKTESQNVIVYSDAHDFTTKAIVSNLEQMRKALTRTMGLQPGSSLPTTIFIFDGDPDFAPARKAILDRDIDTVAGLCIPAKGRFFIAMRTDSAGVIERIVYHELTHSLVGGTVAGLPLWYQEGIAEFYSTFKVKGKSVIVGGVAKGDLDVLMETGLMPLRRVFEASSDAKDYNSFHAGAFYQTSWMFIQYLLVGAPERAGQLGKFLELLDAKKPVDVAFQSAFGTTPEQFQGELWKYVNRPKLQVVSYDIPDLNAFTVPPPVVVDVAEVQRAFDAMLALKTK